MVSTAIENSGIKVSAKDATELFTAGFAAILDTVKRKEKASIHNFASFEGIVKKARIGRNPSNGEAVQIPARLSLKFKLMPSVAADLKQTKVKSSKKEAVEEKPAKKSAKPAGKKVAAKAPAKPEKKPVKTAAPVVAKKKRK